MSDSCMENAIILARNDNFTADVDQLTAGYEWLLMTYCKA